MKLLALAGKAGSGKSTTLECLKDLQHHPLALKKFAGPLIDMQEMIYARIKPVYERPSNFVKDRFLLQFLGTEWGRQTISDTIWVDLWKLEIDRFYKAANNLAVEPIFVVDDLRFDNEAEAVKSLGGHIIQIVSTKVNDRNVVPGIPNHTSENGIDLKYIDYIIENNGSIDDLKQSLCTLNDKLHIW